MGAVQSLPNHGRLPPVRARLDQGAQLPYRQTEGSAGYDLSAFEVCEVQPGATAKIRTGVYASIPRGLFGSIKGRSSLALSGIFAFEGTIDSDYRGEICVILHNTRDFVFSISANQRIAQMVLLPYAELKFEEVFELDLTVRGDGGFGSTGTEMYHVESNGTHKNSDAQRSGAASV